MLLRIFTRGASHSAFAPIKFRHTPRKQWVDRKAGEERENQISKVNSRFVDSQTNKEKTSGNPHIERNTVPILTKITAPLRYSQNNSTDNKRTYSTNLVEDEVDNGHEQIQSQNNNKTNYNKRNSGYSGTQKYPLGQTQKQNSNKGNHKISSNTKKYTPDYTKGKAHKQGSVYQAIGALIYGIHPIQLALDAQRRTFHHLMYKRGCETTNERIREIVDTANERGIKTSSLTPAQFKQVLKGDQVHQGVCCDVSHLPFKVFQVKKLEDTGAGKGEEEMIYNGKGDQYKMTREGETNALNTDTHLDNRRITSEESSKENVSATKPSMQYETNALNTQLVNGSKGSEENISATKPTIQYETNTLYTQLVNGRTTNEESSKENTTARDGNESPKLCLYLDQIQDPMNFGAVLRSAYFFGVDKVLVSEKNSCSLSGVVSKASAGVCEVLPVYSLPHPPVPLLTDLAAAGWVLVATAHHHHHHSHSHQGSITPLHLFTPPRNTLLILGSEGDGIQKEIMDLCEVVLSIPPTRPLHPAASCLNVSAATAVLLHTLTINMHN